MAFLYFLSLPQVCLMGKDLVSEDREIDAFLLCFLLTMKKTRAKTQTPFFNTSTN